MTVRAVSNRPTSPVYNSNAPNLTGQTGSLISVLDAVLVNGFTGFTALGWTKPYSSTTVKGQYQGAAGGTSAQLFVDDNAPGAGGAKEARVNGFKTGSAIGVGTGQFPSTAQMTSPSGALVVRKSTTADATVRYWTIVGNGQTIYMFVDTGDLTFPVTTYPWMFGDFFTYNASDTSNCAIIARGGENTNQTSVTNYSGNALWNNAIAQSNSREAFAQLCGQSTTIHNDALWHHYAMASFTNVGGSILFGKDSDLTTMGYPGQTQALTPQMGYLGNGPANNGGTFPTACPYPNSADGGLFLAPVFIHHSNTRRGYFKGMWNPCHHLPLNHDDTFSGTNNLSGKSFLVQNIMGMPSQSAGAWTSCQVFIEYSDTWS